MKTIINIGTSIGNFTNVEFDKPFSEIKYDDIREYLISKNEVLFGTTIYGWMEVNINKQ